MEFRLPKIDNINDPIARSVFRRKQEDGQAVEVVIVIGRPEQIADRAEWFCPVSIDGYTGGVIPMVGVVPVDALMNAVDLVSKFVMRENAYPLRPM